MGFVAHRSKDEQQVDVMRGRIVAHLKALVERRPLQQLIGQMTEMVDQGLFRMTGPALFFGEVPLAARRLRALIHMTPYAGLCEIAVQWISPSAPWRGVFLAIHHLESGKRWEKLFAPETAGGFRDRTRSEEEDIVVNLHTYGIEEAVALLQHDLPRLHQYLQLYHPELVS